MQITSEIVKNVIQYNIFAYRHTSIFYTFQRAS